MSDQSQLLEVELSERAPPAYAGEWVPISLSLKRSPAATSPVWVKNIACQDHDVQLDTDLFPSDLEIRPGETYQFTLPVRSPQPKNFQLEKIGVQVAQDTDEKNDQLLSLPKGNLAIRPAIVKEVGITVRPLCAYAEGTKLEVTISHAGRTRFTDLAITLGPEGAVRAGKRVIRLPSFGPDDPAEKVEVVVAGKALEIAMEALVDNNRTECRLKEKIPQPGERQTKPFRFLEPRRLSTADQLIYTAGEGEECPVVSVDGAFPVRGGQRYQVVIRPKDPGVTTVQLRDIPGLIHVRKCESADGAWKFLIDVSFTDRFSKAERLFYDVESKDGPLNGEIPVRLVPAWGKHFQLACALGIALTVQGVTSLLRLLLKSDASLEDAFSHFNFASDYQLLFLLFIPVCWLGLRLSDGIQFRLGN